MATWNVPLPPTVAQGDSGHVSDHNSIKDAIAEVRTVINGEVTTSIGTKAPLASPAFTGTPTGITKAHVGLGSVDNTSDANKPVSTDQATAISKRLPVIRWTGTAWEARPAGAPFGALFLSTNDPLAPAPSVGVLTGDMWERHPDAI